MKTFKTIMSVVALFISSAMASAQTTFEVDGINYSVLSPTDKTVEVTSKTEKYSGDIIIPSTVIYNDEEFSVTSIGSHAFYYSPDLISVTIPNSVTSIGDYAFSECYGLTSANISNSITSIGNFAYSRCLGLTSLTIPNSLKNISEGAFYECSGLTSVTIPNSVTCIGSHAFQGCSGLTSVTIPNSVTSISDYAFLDCLGLTSVTIESKTPASLGNDAFSNVKLILVPFTEYDAYVSEWSTYASIIKHPFEKDGIYYEVTSSTNKTVKVVAGDNIYSGDVVIPAQITYEGVELAVTNIGYQAFYDCSDLTSITIPNSVTSIENQAFLGCSILTSINIPNSVTNIGDKAFYGCHGLTSATIPNSVASIGSDAFNWCISLVATMESETPASLGNNTFSYVKLILVPLIAYDAYVSSWSGYASIIKHQFEKDGIYYEVTSSTNKTIRVVAGEKEYTGDVVIPAQITYEGVELAVTSIDSDAFRNCSSLTSVTIPNSVISIGSEAFSGCSSLASITIPSNVTNIGNKFFYDCAELTSVTIPNSVTSIGSEAFSGCSSLASITIPSNVTNIGYNAFCNCHNLVVTMESETPVDLSQNALDGVKSILVPITAYDTYVSEWNYTYAYKIKIPIEKDGIYYEVTSSKTVEVVTGENKYTGNVVIPAQVAYEGVELAVTSIGFEAFSGCSDLTSVTIPNSVTNIGEEAFESCSGLTSITIPSSVTYIDSRAFIQCRSLVATIESNTPASLGYNVFWNVELILVPFTAYDAYISKWSIYADKIKIPFEKDGIYYEVTSSTNKTAKVVAGENKYTGDVVIPAQVTYEGVELAVTSIGSSAFYDCSGLTSVTIPNSVNSIGSYAFSGCSGLSLVEMMPEVAPECSQYPFNSTTAVVIPNGAYDSYSQATYWKDYANMFTEKGDDVKTVTIEAADAESSLHKAIGEENLAKVVDLTINGTINSYDFMVMRNKMTLLRKVDMSNAKIVYNAYEHYTGYHTENDQFPDYAFYDCNLISINLPKDIRSIGRYSFCNTNLKEIIIPDSVTSINAAAFNGCYLLNSVAMPNSVTSIGSYAFSYCSNLSSIKLPPSLKTIGYEAFCGCNALTDIRIPASVRTLENSAFGSCDKLKSIYVYTVEPMNISQNTFDFGDDQVLYAPKVSYTTYWYNTQWSQFKTIKEFDEPYENFYLNGDKELDNSTGAIEGEGDNNPDAEMGSGSGLIVGGDVNQDLGDVEIENGGSIIVDGTGGVNADKLTFNINVTGGKWYFFCFPFDIKAEDIKCKNGSDYVFRYYDGEERAKNGKGGWKNVTSDGSGNFIKAGRGYIFQSSATDVLCITAKNGKIKKEDKYNELVEFITQNVHDASWNFVGNPYLSYYEVTNEDYNAPITIWNGSGYEAIRPGDDDYHLAPFEAFFVQKPTGNDKVNYENDRQMTKNQSDKKKAEKGAEARMRGGVRMLDNGRKMVNITLSDGTATDRTRIVFNESVSMDYEMECDAAKFGSAGIPQLYTLDTKQVKYAINERPLAEGMVAVGYSVEKQGTYTIAAQRMDTQMVLKDYVTGNVHDFTTDGDYTFMTEAGTFNSRFTLMIKCGDATSIEGVNDEVKVKAVDGGLNIIGSGSASVKIYNAGGAIVASQNGDGTVNLPAGTYIVNVGDKNIKVTLK